MVRTEEFCATVAPVAVSVLSDVVAPTAPANVTVPLVPPPKVKVRVPLALTVPFKVILEPAGVALMVLRATFAPTVITPFKTIAPPLVVILAFKLIGPTLPEPAVNVNPTPELVMLMLLLTVMKLAAAFIAQRETLVAEAAMVLGASV